MESIYSVAAEDDFSVLLDDMTEAWYNFCENAKKSNKINIDLETGAYRMKQRWMISILAAGACLLSSCGATKATDVEKTSEPIQTIPPILLTTTAAATTTVTETTALQMTSTVGTVAAGELGQAEMDSAGAEEMQIFESTAFLCSLELPSGWVATEGVQDGAIVDATSVFQPETPNGDSISLVVQSGAEDPVAFAAITAEDLAAAYAQSMENVTVTAMETLTVAGCPAYRLTLYGEAGGIPIEITQLFVNRTDAAQSGYLYVLTYTNASGQAIAYPDTLEHYFMIE